MGHQLAYRAAADGKHPVSKITITSRFFAIARRPAFAAAALFVTAFASTAGHAQSGPFAGMAGTWSGGGSVSLDDGSNERIRCRATYQVGGPRMTMNLVCASDSYKFNLGADVQAQGSAVSGSWTETSRNINGTLQGRGGGGNFQVVASAPGFNADIAMRTSGNRQSVTIRADNQFRGANITLSK
ncbi:hypothetical protein ABIF38_006669 [Bradyrhizobium japonicum]|jgi:hypothetical protein|uniref:Uncharacterized protein n=1 Tax=Bradyrhizobium elkanii TaxID=29448 RepID=A0ABV4F0N1_BRAEL|nr:hypothetical protein [Bradyrhizobium elkanii]UQD78067.1 hypothetical protein JEY66_24145 [Bradyrhizobium elkanii USDA 76]BBC00328.1 hypothetical protein BE61_57850 [Bradyrhizobium elkanii USDA 61]ODM71266.1 hypothetical protein A6452_08745 [Bradyrhizobium elkanii]ODM76218.1 hypothetical protein A6X20_30955 [Bradyrhizobium elkanii]